MMCAKLNLQKAQITWQKNVWWAGTNNDHFVIDVREINHIRTVEMKSNEKWSSQLRMQFMQLHKKPEKNSGLQRDLNLWPLSYEATDVGSRSIIMHSYVPMKEMNVIDVYEINNHFTCQYYCYYLECHSVQRVRYLSVDWHQKDLCLC